MDLVGPQTSVALRTLTKFQRLGSLVLFHCLVGGTKGGTFGLRIAGRGVSGLIPASSVPLSDTSLF